MVAWLGRFDSAATEPRSSGSARPMVYDWRSGRPMRCTIMRTKYTAPAQANEGDSTIGTMSTACAVRMMATVRTTPHRRARPAADRTETAVATLMMAKSVPTSPAPAPYRRKNQ